MTAAQSLDDLISMGPRVKAVDMVFGPNVEPPEVFLTADIRDVAAMGDRNLRRARHRFWDRLAASSDAEEKLFCQRVIDRISEALGAAMAHALAASWKQDAEDRAAEAAHAAHARSLARWQ